MMQVNLSDGQDDENNCREINMNKVTKKKIDDMDYESMLRLHRFAPLGDPMFIGETGKYFGSVMKQKRIKVGEVAHVAASKRIGWR